MLSNSSGIPKAPSRILSARRARAKRRRRFGRAVREVEPAGLIDREWNFSGGCRAAPCRLGSISGWCGFLAVLAAQADQQIERREARGCLDLSDWSGDLHLRSDRG